MELILVVFISCGMVENSHNGFSRSLRGALHVLSVASSLFGGACDATGPTTSVA